MGGGRGDRGAGLMFRTARAARLRRLHASATSMRRVPGGLRFCRSGRPAARAVGDVAMRAGTTARTLISRQRSEASCPGESRPGSATGTISRRKTPSTRAETSSPSTPATAERSAPWRRRALPGWSTALTMAQFFLPGTAMYRADGSYVDPARLRFVHHVLEQSAEICVTGTGTGSGTLTSRHGFTAYLYHLAAGGGRRTTCARRTADTATKSPLS